MANLKNLFKILDDEIVDIVPNRNNFFAKRVLDNTLDMGYSNPNIVSKATDIANKYDAYLAVPETEVFDFYNPYPYELSRMLRTDSDYGIDSLTPTPDIERYTPSAADEDWLTQYFADLEPRDVVTDNYGTAQRLYENAYDMGMPMSDETFSKFQDVASKYDLGHPYDIDGVRGIDLFPSAHTFPRTAYRDIYIPTVDGVHKGNTKLRDFYDKLYIEDSVARGLPFNRNEHYGWTGAPMEAEMWHPYGRFGNSGNSPSFKSLFKHLDDAQIEQLLREYRNDSRW